MMKRIWIDLILIVVIGTGMFAKVTSAYFCGYDDFGETHRAAFEDSKAPSHIFTTTHFGTTKYRPLNRLTTFVSWKFGHGSALPFRIRNLAFHLICALCIYGIVWVWARDRLVALVCGMFFCLEPTANQTVVAAVFTNTVAYACLLSGFLSFLQWRESKQTGWLFCSMGLILIGLFFYEPVIVVFALMGGYLALEYWRGKTTVRKELIPWAGGVAAVTFVFALVRHFVVRGTSPRVPTALIAHNFVLYMGALLSPIDAVTANELFGAPLPPQLHFDRTSLVWLLLAFAAIVVALVSLLRRRAVQENLKRLDKGLLLFLGLAIPVVLSPFLLFTPHASETYLYLPTALFVILLGISLRALLPSKWAYGAVVVLILLSFATGTWIRNNRVLACGEIADTIIHNLPTAHWKSGQWNITLSDFPDQTPPPRYGIYNYKGLSTIDPDDQETGIGAQNALQTMTGNSALRAEINNAPDAASACVIPETCFDVSLSGSVRPAVSNDGTALGLR
jgi:hypothetical protein